MAIYLDLDGKKTKGNVTAEGYVDTIRVDSFQFGCGRPISMESGNLSNREASVPHLSECTWSHKTDNSATALFKAAVSGDAGVTAIFHFVQTGAKKASEYMTYKLYDVLVSGYSISADGEGDPIESVSFSYSKIEITYMDHNATNKAQAKAVVNYDVAKATAG